MILKGIENTHTRVETQRKLSNWVLRRKWFIITLVILLLFKTRLTVHSIEPVNVGNLPIGSIVFDPAWTWEHKTGSNYTGAGTTKSIEWVVVAKNHNGYPSNSVTLMTKEIIAYGCFDDSTNRGDAEGSNHWGNSGTPNATFGIRTFLNSTFYNKIGETMKDNILLTDVSNVTNTNSAYITKDNIILPSATELGDDYNSYPVGSQYEYMTNNSRRIKSLDGYADRYSTRSIFKQNNTSARVLIDNYGMGGNTAKPNQTFGIVAVVNVKSTMLVDLNGNGTYSVTEPNTAPTITITNPTAIQAIAEAGTIAISGVVTDPDTETLTVSATIGGKEKTTTITAPAVNKSWSLSWTGKELAEGVYGTIVVTVTDSKGAMSSANHTGKKSVIKTPPVITINTYPTEYTRNDITVTATVDKGTLNANSYTFKENGSFVFSAEDSVGNIAFKVVKITNIDKISPTITVRIIS